MHFLAISLQKDWARMRRDPSQLTIALGIPLVLAVLLSLVFGRAPVTPHGRLLVADEDQSIASSRFLEAFHRDPLDKMITVEAVTRNAGRARIDRGEASAFLIIPAGLQQAFVMKSPYQLELYSNPSQRILPQIVEETLSTTVEVAFYMRRTNLSPAMNQPLITLDTAVIHAKKSTANFATTFLPSMLFMSMLFLASGTAADIWKERMLGTLRRIACSPVSMAQYLGSRVVFVAMLYLVVASMGLEAAIHLAGMTVPNLAAAAAWLTFVGTLFYLLFLWIAVQASNARAASVLANLIIFPLAMLGGSFFPFEWMPGWMVAIGRLTPNGWALTQFKTILDGSADAAHLAASVGMLAALSAVAFYFTARRLKLVFAV